METKDIIILAMAFALIGFSFYRKYAKQKNAGGTGRPNSGTGPKGSLKDQPDDYEPYAGKKNGE